MSRFLRSFRRGGRGGGVIRDPITKSPVKLTDEFLRRCSLINTLIYELGYPKELVDVNVKVVADGKTVGVADVVVYKDDKFKDIVSNSYIIAVVREGGLNELRNLMKVSTAEYGIWSDGVELTILRRGVADVFEEVSSIPKYGHSLNSLNIPVRIPDMIPITDLRARIDSFIRYLRKWEKKLKDYEVFDELLKLLVLKATSEAVGDEEGMWISNEEFVNIIRGGDSRLSERVNKVLSRLGAYGFDCNLMISIRSLAEFLRRFNGASILKSSDRAKVEVIHSIARSRMRPNEGCVLTPQIVAEFMIKLVRPEPNELVVDPACGSGTLVAHLATYLKETYKLGIEGVSKFLKENVLCIDVNLLATRLAAITTTLCCGTSVNVLVADALSDIGKLQEIAIKNSIPEKLIPRYEGFDIVLAHPPFNVRWRIREPEVLKQFELGFKWRYDGVSMRWIKSSEVLKEQLVEVLFIERCFQLLRPYGRMAILLPEEILTLGSLGYVRQWITENSRVIAIIALPHPTLIAYGLKAKAVILVLQKVPKERLEELRKAEYRTFVASVEKVGYDALGNPVYKRDMEGVIVTDEFGRPLLDTDVDYVIREYYAYLNNEGINFNTSMS